MARLSLSQVGTFQATLKGALGEHLYRDQAGVGGVGVIADQVLEMGKPSLQAQGGLLIQWIVTA